MEQGMTFITPRFDRTADEARMLTGSPPFHRSRKSAQSVAQAFFHHRIAEHLVESGAHLIGGGERLAPLSPA